MHSWDWEENLLVFVNRKSSPLGNSQLETQLFWIMVSFVLFIFSVFKVTSSMEEANFKIPEFQTSSFEETYVEFSERGQDALKALTSEKEPLNSSYRFSFSDFFKLDPVQHQQHDPRQIQKEIEEELRAWRTMDKDYAPLSQHCVRALCDKMYDKRKAAALEIEK